MPKIQQPTAVGIKRRACVNCTAGKAKCSPLSENVCERCHRLEKDCVYLNVASKRKSPKTNSRVQLLETKVEELAALLASQPKASQAQGPAENSPQDAFSSKDSAILQSFRSLDSSEATSNPTPLTSLPESDSDDFGAWDIIDRGLVSLEIAQILLDNFRCKGAWNFPFVIISPETSLNSIRRDSPFLFVSIMASMSFDNSPLQRQLGEEIRTQIHRRMLLKFESSLELLQGLLVHLAWHYYFILPHKHQMLLLSQMCVSLVHQLEIDKNPKNKKRRMALELGDHEEEETATRSTAEMRAMLGTYYLSSSFATSFRRRSFMPYTKYISQCCALLAQKKELLTDELISYFVRNQELSRRVQDTFSYDDLDNTEIRGEQITDITTRSLLSELDSLQSTVPDSLHHNTILKLEFLLLRSWIYEVAFHGEFWVTPGSDTSLVPKASSVTTARIKLLLISLRSWKAFLEAFVSVSNSEMLYLTYPIHSKMCYTLISLANLVHLNFSGGLEHKFSEGCLWNLGVAAREAELPLLARQVQEKFKANARSEVGANADPDAMTIFSVLIGSFISHFEKRMKELQTVKSSGPAASSTAESAVTQDQFTTDMDSTIFLGADAMGTDYYGDTGTFYLGQDSNIQLDVFGDTVWERLLDDFTMVPFS